MDEGTKPMKPEKLAIALAGLAVFLSVALSLTVSPWWLLLAGFVGLNLSVSAFLEGTKI
jgi:fatty acid desaturase